MKSILITGGTGTIGKALTHRLLRTAGVKRIVVYSRDEQKQSQFEEEIADPRLRFFLGDVRDLGRLKLAVHECETIIHTAALKIVPKCEYDPIETVHTNVGGTENVIRAALETDSVHKVMLLSTDKAVNPINLYGATKLAAEKLMVAANNLRGSRPLAFSVCRYGNVSNSRGSVIPLFRRQVSNGEPITLTHPQMTRFWITIDEAVEFICCRIMEMDGAEIFVPKLRPYWVHNLAEALVSDKHPHKITGIRPGEKIHETLISADEWRYTLKREGYFIIGREPLKEWESEASGLTSNHGRHFSVGELRLLLEELV